MGHTRPTRERFITPDNLIDIGLYHTLCALMGHNIITNKVVTMIRKENKYRGNKFIHCNTYF